MASEELSRVELQRQVERIRQESDTFDQRRMHENRWFGVRLAIGYCSVVLLPGILGVSSYVVLNSSRFSEGVVMLAAGALFVDVLGAVVAVWKIALAPEAVTRLEPVTEVGSTSLSPSLVQVPLEPARPESNRGRSPGVSYRAHVEGAWLPWVSDGEVAGTTGHARRMEALEVRLTDAPRELSVRYQGHVEDIGWMGWVVDGAAAGVPEQAVRLEAVRIVLDNATPGFHVKYQAHVEKEGWMDWHSDGEVAGTTGQSRRLEAIRIVLTAPESPAEAEA